MSTADYAPPVDKLLTYGEPSRTSSNEWPNYLELGIGPEHIPDLVQMAKDEELNTADSESQRLSRLSTCFKSRMMMIGCGKSYRKYLAWLDRQQFRLLPLF
jgi:hypothetical protein